MRVFTVAQGRAIGILDSKAIEFTDLNPVEALLFSGLFSQIAQIGGHMVGIACFSYLCK